LRKHISRITISSTPIDLRGFFYEFCYNIIESDYARGSCRTYLPKNAISNASQEYNPYAFLVMEAVSPNDVCSNYKMYEFYIPGMKEKETDLIFGNHNNDDDNDDNNYEEDNNPLIKTRKAFFSQDTFTCDHCGVKDGDEANCDSCYLKGGRWKYEYKGEMKDEKPHGKGKTFYENGDIQIEGDFENGEPIYGKMYDEETSGVLVYEGDFKDGNDGEEPHGKGKTFHENGNVLLDCEFKNGEPINGKMYNEDGTLQYEGEFEDGEPKE
jgi:antitoxin component YwqK of YwqJK toxin-antitoxin module